MQCEQCLSNKLIESFPDPNSNHAFDYDKKNKILFTCIECLSSSNILAEIGLENSDLADEILEFKISQADLNRWPSKSILHAGSDHKKFIEIAFLTEKMLAPIHAKTSIRDIKVFIALKFKNRYHPTAFRLLYDGKELKVKNEQNEENILANLGINAKSRLTGLISMSEHAGKSVIGGVKIDPISGNPINVELIPDGGCQGYQVLIIQCRSFDISPCQRALEQMGFVVHVYAKTKSSIASFLPSLATFQNLLLSTPAIIQQLWVTSTYLKILPSIYLDIIDEFHQRGGALYLWGDNDPFNEAVNPVIDRVLPGVKLGGNYHACEYVKYSPPERFKRKPATAGFTDHFIFTGIQRLYEGETIAEFQGAIPPELKFIMNNSAGQPALGIVEKRPSRIGGKGQCGRMAIDVGYTRLFCRWDDAGTTRFVKNISGWLCAIDSDW